MLSQRDGARATENPAQETLPSHADQTDGVYADHLWRGIERHPPHTRAGSVENRDEFTGGGLPDPPVVLDCAFEPNEHFRLALAAKDWQCLLAATSHYEHLYLAILVSHHQPKG